MMPQASLTATRRDFIGDSATLAAAAFADFLPGFELLAGTMKGVCEENQDFLTTQILTYLGNKRSLLKHIGEGVEKVKQSLGKDKLSFFDGFSGSGIVSRFMKRNAEVIFANDLELYSEIVNRCYLTNRSDIDEAAFDRVYRDWVDYTRNHLKGGFITEFYAPKDDENIRPGERVFYTHENAVVLDSARAALDVVVPEKYFNLLLGPLLAEASIHPNTSGVFKGFYKNRQGVGEFGGEGRNALTRIRGEIKLQKPVLSNFDCRSVVLRGDTNEVVNEIEPVDLAYFDPPYNQHPYGSNYFMLNLLAENKQPESVSKVSGIPQGWNHSKYNKKKEAEETFFDLLMRTHARFLMISYNSEGFIKKDRFMAFLGGLGNVSQVDIEYNTFRGSRNLRNRAIKVQEYLFLVEKRV